MYYKYSIQMPCNCFTYSMQVEIIANTYRLKGVPPKLNEVGIVWEWKA